jgi:hypothetical protein
VASAGEVTPEQAPAAEGSVTAQALDTQGTSELITVMHRPVVAVNAPPAASLAAGPEPPPAFVRIPVTRPANGTDQEANADQQAFQDGVVGHDRRLSTHGVEIGVAATPGPRNQPLRRGSSFTDSGPHEPPYQCSTPAASLSDGSIRAVIGQRVVRFGTPFLPSPLRPGLTDSPGSFERVPVDIWCLVDLVWPGPQPRSATNPTSSPTL